MKLSNSMKKFLAYVCAIAMVISSMTFYGQTSVKASGSAAVDGKVYTVTDGDATIVGFTCQGIFDKARIHFAWGTEVDAASVTTTVDGKSVKIDGTNAHGMFIPLSEVSTLAVGEYQIVISATATENSATVTGNATLKIEDEGETTTRDPSVKVYVDLGEGFSYDDSTTATVVGIQQPDWSPEKGIYANVPAGISTVSVNGKTGDEVAKIQGAGVIVYLSAMTKKTNTVEIEYAGGTATVIVKNENGTDDGDTPTVAPTEAPTVAPTEAPTVAPTEAPTVAPTEQPTEAPTAAPTEKPTEAPTVAPTEAPTAAPTEAPTAAPTEKPTEAPTVAPTEAPTVAPTEAPTVAPTEAPTEAPTQKPTVAPTTAKVKVGTAKVKSASKKNASAKAKISLKKVNGATKYQVQVSASKNFKKVLVKKTVKKLSFTVKSRKIKNKKKLYVRAKAVKVVGKKSYTGKWSKAKKIKVK